MVANNKNNNCIIIPLAFRCALTMFTFLCSLCYVVSSFLAGSNVLANLVNRTAKCHNVARSYPLSLRWFEYRSETCIRPCHFEDLCGETCIPVASGFQLSPEEFSALLDTFVRKISSFYIKFGNCYQFLTLGSRQTPILRRSFRYFSIFTPLVYFSLRCSFSCSIGEDTDCVFERRNISFTKTSAAI